MAVRCVVGVEMAEEVRRVEEIELLEERDVSVVSELLDDSSLSQPYPCPG